MTGRAKLKAVPATDKPLDMAGDIYAKAKAEIEKRDWATVHIEADRRNLPRGLFGWLR